MTFTQTPLDGAYVVNVLPLQDNRGWFARTYCKDEFSQIGHNKEWVQINHSFTVEKGTVRGMHYQPPPNGEIKLVRCIAGEVYDVVIDLRKGSSTFLQWFGILLSSKNKTMIYIPEGFAHGFQALSDNCELIYHHSSFYAPGNEKGIKYDDHLIGIEWPLPVTEISDRDKRHAYLDINFKGM